MGLPGHQTAHIARGFKLVHYLTGFDGHELVSRSSEWIGMRSGYELRNFGNMRSYWCRSAFDVGPNRNPVWNEAHDRVFAPQLGSAAGTSKR
jgi:hypothetical protein